MAIEGIQRLADVIHQGFLGRTVRPLHDDLLGQIARDLPIEQLAPAAGPLISLLNLSSQDAGGFVRNGTIDVLGCVGGCQIDERGKLGITRQRRKVLQAVAGAIDEAGQMGDEAIALIEEGNPLSCCSQPEPQLVGGCFPFLSVAKRI